MIGHQLLYRAGQLGGLDELMCVLRFIHILTCTRPDKQKNTGGVFSTFGFSTSKYSPKKPKPKSARVLGDKLHA